MSTGQATDWAKSEIMGVPLGRLDGLVIFRFALAYKNGGGGIEEHLRNANRVLLERNRMTIIQTYVSSKGDENSVVEEAVGRGRLIWIPIQELETTRSWRSTDVSTLLWLWPRLRNGISREIVSRLIGGTAGKLFLSKMSNMNKSSSFRFLSNANGALASNLFQQYGFDLAVLHSIGSLDDLDIMGRLNELGVPVAAIYHYENRLLTHPMVRLKLQKVAAIGGVSSIGVPRYLQRRFLRVREGVDTEFFQVQRASPLAGFDERYSIFMPARITRLKGQLDRVAAANVLSREGLKVRLVLAGRTDSEGVMRELTSAINRLDDPRQVLLLGNLDKVAMRDWYAACKVVALPTYSEGLGRVLLEAQSMKRPVVAYEVGGIPQAMRHGETGFIVQKGDIAGLAGRLRELLLDDHKRVRMGESGRNFVVNEFSVQRLAESHENVYLSALRSLDTLTPND